jgi:hypothetical protein
LPVVTAEPIDAELGRSPAWLDDAGAAHARYTSCGRHARRDPGLEPAHGIGALGKRIRKRPSATAGIPLTAGSALGGIARADGKAGIIAPWPIEAYLSLGRLPKRRAHHQQQQAQRETASLHVRILARINRRIP